MALPDVQKVSIRVASVTFATHRTAPHGGAQSDRPPRAVVKIAPGCYGCNLNRSIRNPTTAWAAQSIFNRRPMTSPIMISRKALCLVLALSPLSLGITDAAEADARVYKCTQPNGTVLYTDVPCKDGTAVDIRLGPADPAAPARLAHAQAELDAVAAQRRAEEEIARREELSRLHLEAEAEQGPTVPLADYPNVDYGPVYGPSKGHAHRRGSPSKLHEDTRHNEGRVPPTVRGPGARMDAR